MTTGLGSAEEAGEAGPKGSAAVHTIDEVMGDHPGRVDPLTIQTLNLLYNDVFAPIALGIACFSIGNGVAILAWRGLPPWVGWLGIAVGVVSLTPLSLAGFLGLAVWILIVSASLSSPGHQAGRTLV